MCVALLLGCDTGSTTTAPEVPELPVIKELPDFELTERGGKTIRRADLLGKIWIADFIFTKCEGPCPLLSKRMAGLQSTLTPETFPGVRFLSITVDPATDTPQVLSKYADMYGADPERWLFLTGEKSAIHALVGKNGFLLPVGEPDDAGLITHSIKFVLVDKKARIRAYFDGTSEPEMKRLRQAIARLGS